MTQKVPKTVVPLAATGGWLQKLVNPYKMSIFTEMKLVFYNLSVDIFSLQNDIRGLISK